MCFSPLLQVNLLHYYYNHFTAVWTLSGTTRVSRYRKNLSPTHTYRGHPLSASSICYDPWHSPLFNLHASVFIQILSKFSLVCFLPWHPPLHTAYISSTSHCLLFAAHAHTIATCSAVIPRLSSIRSLSTLYLELLSCSLTSYQSDHSHLCPL